MWSSRNPSSHPTYVRHVTLSNLNRMPLSFAVEPSGPFELVSAETSFPKLPDDLVRALTHARPPDLKAECHHTIDDALLSWEASGEGMSKRERTKAMLGAV